MRGFLITLLGLLLISGAAFSTLSMSSTEIGFWHIMAAAYVVFGFGLSIIGLKSI